MAKCQHNWKIFRDPELVGKKQLSFYCTKCLELKKVKKQYNAQ